MKKFYQFIAVVGLSLATTLAFGQSLNGNSNALGKKVVAHLAKSPAVHMSHKPSSTTTYAFLDYPFSDSLYTQSLGEGYAGSPSLGQYYIQNMNMHYVSADTGATLANQLLIRWCAVSFDTLLDAVTGTGYTGTGLTVDSLFIPVGQENNSGKNDTITIKIVNDSTYGLVGHTVYWSTQIIQDTGLSGIGKSWFYGHTIVLAPQISVPGKFTVVMEYADPSKVDTMGFLFGYPTFNCTTPSGALPDTSQIGTAIPLVSPSSGTLKVANSFANGFEYFYSGHTGKPLTLPNQMYGDFIGYNCTSPSEFSASSFQDIAMYAEVSFTNVTGINTVSATGLSVGQNAPNPFNKNTEINYSLTKSSEVVFSVYDLTGRKLVENAMSNVAPGQHVINLSANQFTPGVYFYSFNVNGNVVTKRMVITQ